MDAEKKHHTIRHFLPSALEAEEEVVAGEDVEEDDTVAASSSSRSGRRINKTWRPKEEGY